MKFSLSLLVFLSSLKVVAQKTIVSGTVTIWNSKTTTGKYQNVANAIVTADSGKAQLVQTDHNGQFKLTIIGVNQQETVSFHIKAPGLQVVNIDALKAVGGQDQAIKILMAKPQDLTMARFLTYKISETEAYKELNAKQQKNNEKLAEERQKTPYNSGRMSELEWEQRELKAVGNKIDGQSQYMAKAYGAINLDDVSPVFKKTYQMFQRGQIDSALQALKNANTEKSIIEIKRKQTKANNTFIFPNDQQLALDQEIKYKGEALLFEARLHGLRFEFNQASASYTWLFQVDPLNPDYLSDYAHFLDLLNRRDSAMVYYSKALVQYDLKSTKYTAQIARTLNSVGILYARKGNFKKAVADLLDSQVLWEQLAAIDSGAYGRDISGTYNNLGIIYAMESDFAKAENAYQSAFAWLKNLEQNDPEGYALDEADTKNNLGLLYYDENDFPKAESAFKQALQIYQQLGLNHPGLYEATAAGTKNNLGNLYADNNHLADADTIYREALLTYRRLAKNNPDTYLPKVELVLNNLGDVCVSEHNFVKAEEMYLEALTIAKHLATNAPDSYTSDIASVENSLGRLYEAESDLKKALAAFQDALDKWKILASHDHEIYDKQVASALINIGTVYFLEGDYKRADDAYLQALNKERQLVKNNKTFEPELATVLNDLAYSDQTQKSFEEAVKAYREALEIRQRLCKAYPDRFLPDVAQTEYNLGSVYYDMKVYGQAEYYLIPALRIDTGLQAANPKVFTLTTRQTADTLLSVYYGMLDSAKYEALRNPEAGHFGTVEDILITQAKKDNNVALKLAAYYSDRAWFLLFASKFKEAQQAAEKGLALAPAEIWIKTNLAHALLFQGKYNEALQIYGQLKGLNDPHGTPYVVSIAADFDELQKQEITNRDVKKIRAFLKVR